MPGPCAGHPASMGTDLLIEMAGTSPAMTWNQMNILLTPARIGPVEIKNRIVMPPMTTRTADAEGYVTDDFLAYYMARVNGGVGLITVEMASPEKCGGTAATRSAFTTIVFCPA